MLQDEILLEDFVGSCLLSSSGSCWGLLESEFMRKEGFREPRDHFL